MSELGQMALRYVDMLTEPEGFRAWAHERFLDREYLVSRVIGKKEAEALSDCEGVYDAREADYPIIEGGKQAVITCTACGGKTIVRYQKEENCPAEIEWWSPTDDASLHQVYNHDMVCPQCGTDCRLIGCRDMTQGREQQARICVPYVLGGMLYLADVLASRRVFEYGEKRGYAVLQVYVFDGKNKAHLRQYRRNPFGGGRWYLNGWEERQRFLDELGACYLYDENLPKLEGTPLENCRLWDYWHQTDEVFAPAAWMRLWQKHRNAEVLMDAGLGKQLGVLMKEECRGGYGYYSDGYYRAPVLKMIDWKKKKPTAMLGMNRQEMERMKRTDLSAQGLRLVLERRGEAGRMMDLLARRKNNADELKSILKLPYRAEKVLSYLERQNKRVYYLKDYWDMAEECELDLEQAAVRWPKDLAREHDRVMAIREALRKEKEKQENAGHWMEMNTRLQGLCWEKDGICIRPAHSTAELVEEGQKLHHCVGGYTRNHLNGRIILFIRHTRRPERSWYTLSINLETRMRIQLHGYGNERANGKVLHIPKEVLAFVNEWEETVLANWRDPEKQKGKNNGKRTEAA